MRAKILNHSLIALPYQARRATEHHRRPKLARGMSRLLCVLVSSAILVGANVNTRGEASGVLLHEADAYMGAGTNQWWLPLERVERLPRWGGQGDPPVSIDQALRVARKWIAPKSGNGDVHRILLRPINPDSLASKFRFCYFYTIEFCVSPYGNHITCVVLMDGTVLEPKLLPGREPEPRQGGANGRQPSGSGTNSTPAVPGSRRSP
jgi:hypothetical protein